MGLPETLLPPTDDPGREDMVRLAELLREPASAEIVTSGGDHAGLPRDVAVLLQSVLDAMSHGKAVTVIAADDLLTTREAADVLNISRPTLSRLMDAGEISYEVRGKHRRVRHADVLDYQRRNRKSRKAALDEMAKESQGWDIDPDADMTFPVTR